MCSDDKKKREEWVTNQIPRSKKYSEKEKRRLERDAKKAQKRWKKK